MAEQEQVETVSSETQQQEETLDDVLSQFPIESAAQSFNAQPRQQEPSQRPPDFNVPDPTYDPDGFKQTMKSLQSNDWEVKQTINRISEQLQGEAQRRQREAEEVDISQAIKSIQKTLPTLEGKDRLVKGYLGAMAAEDPRIAKVWENRRSNPTAWNKTLNALTRQLAKDFEFQADPQLAENTRAAKASRDQMGTTSRPDPDDKFKGMNPGEFQAYWDRLVNS